MATGKENIDYELIRTTQLRPGGFLVSSDYEKKRFYNEINKLELSYLNEYVNSLQRNNKVYGTYNTSRKGNYYFFISLGNEYDITIRKDGDEYFLLRCNRHISKYSGKHTTVSHYTCDQVEGVINCINNIISSS